MNHRFLPGAKQDLNDAVDYYETCQKGLGTDFLIEIRKTVYRILEYPDGWTEISKNGRRCLTNRFPYELTYTIEDDSILILNPTVVVVNCRS